MSDDKSKWIGHKIEVDTETMDHDIYESGGARPMEEFAPCPTCRQYSHSIGEDQVAEAHHRWIESD